MSENNPTVVRDPNSFINERTVQKNRTPFELTNGVYCDSRNAASQDFQNYTAYSSSVEDLSALVNKASQQCVDASIVEDRLFKCVEDVCGNAYLLFKDIENENNITSKKNFVGKLFIFDSDRNPVLTIDSLVVEELELVNVNVFYDKIVLVGESQVWFTTCKSFETFSLGYMSYFNVISDENENPLFIIDQILGEFNLRIFDGENIKTISTNLTATITSAVLNTKEGRIELFLTDSDIAQNLRIYEYDLSEKVWDGIELLDFPYELLGGYSKDGKWSVFFEQLTYPNYVGGSCYTIELPASAEVDQIDCQKEGDLYIEYGPTISAETIPAEIKNISTFGDLTSKGTSIKWRSISQAEDGRLIAAPYAASEIMIIDPETDTVSFGPSVSGITSSSQKWVSSLVASNGLIYAAPHAAGGILIIDASGETLTLDTSGSAWQTRGIAESQGKLFLTTFSGTTNRVFIHDLETQINTNILFDIDRSGPFYSIRTDWESYADYTFDRYWGAVTANNGKVFGIPFTSDRISIIDPFTMTAKQGLDTLDGNAEIPPIGQPIDFNNGAYTAKYSGGALSSVNQCIYAMPRHANAILKINPDTEMAEEIPLPTELYSATLSKSFSTVEGPNGLIYSTPWQMPYLFWINPATDEIGWVSLEDIKDDFGASGNWFTYAVTVGNSIYFAAGSATKILKVEF